MVRALTLLAYALGAGLMLLLIFPLLGLVAGTSLSGLWGELNGGAFRDAFWLTLRTSLLSLLVVVVIGTPVAWWLTRTASLLARFVQSLAYVPVLLPPAVLGVALLFTFGRAGLVGAPLTRLGLSLPFSTSAVVLAQVIVSAPFYLLAAANAFRQVDDDLMLVARTLGQSRAGAFFRVAVPVALPGLLGGAAFSWARATGEFGATLLFAGNLPRQTQTLPLAIYAALETDVTRAVALSVLLVAAFALVLCALAIAIAWGAAGRSLLAFLIAPGTSRE